MHIYLGGSWFGLMWRVDGSTLVCREVGFLFRRSAEGWKPNSVRMVSPALHNELRAARPHLRTVRVFNELGEEFERDLLDLTELGNLVGVHLWVASWKHQ